MDKTMQRNIFIHIITLIIVILSKSVFWGIKYKELTYIPFVIVATIILIRNKFKYLNSQNFKRTYIILLILALNIFLNINNGIKLKSVLFMMSLVIVMGILQEYVYLDEYKEAYINIIVFLSILSLVFSMLVKYIPASELPFYRDEFIDGMQYKYSFIGVRK